VLDLLVYLHAYIYCVILWYNADSFYLAKISLNVHVYTSHCACILDSQPLTVGIRYFVERGYISYLTQILHVWVSQFP